MSQVKPTQVDMRVLPVGAPNQSVPESAGGWYDRNVGGCFELVGRETKNSGANAEITHPILAARTRVLSRATSPSEGADFCKSFDKDPGFSKEFSKEGC